MIHILIDKLYVAPSPIVCNDSNLKCGALNCNAFTVKLILFIWSNYLYYLQLQLLHSVNTDDNKPTMLPPDERDNVALVVLIVLL